MKLTATDRRAPDTVRCTVIQDDMAHQLTVTVPAHLTNQEAAEWARIIVTERKANAETQK